MCAYREGDSLPADAAGVERVVDVNGDLWERVDRGRQWFSADTQELRAWEEMLVNAPLTPVRGESVNLCEVDVFEGYASCDEPGSIAYGDGETKILLCVNHATELASAKGSQ